MEIPGQGEWKRAHVETNPDFHLDPKKEVDPTEELIEQYGPEGAVAELEERIKNGDADAQRQLALIENRLEDLLARIRQRTNH